MSALIADSHAIEITMLAETYSSILITDTRRMDETARSAHGTKTITSYIRDASIGDDVASRAFQRAVVHAPMLLVITGEFSHANNISWN